MEKTAVIVIILVVVAVFIGGLGNGLRLYLKRKREQKFKDRLKHRRVRATEGQVSRPDAEVEQSPRRPATFALDFSDLHPLEAAVPDEDLRPHTPQASPYPTPAASWTGDGAAGDSQLMMSVSLPPPGDEATTPSGTSFRGPDRAPPANTPPPLPTPLPLRQAPASISPAADGR